MIFLSTVLILCCLWYFFKFLAHFSPKIHDEVRKLSVYTQFFQNGFSQRLQHLPILPFFALLH